MDNDTEDHQSTMENLWFENKTSQTGLGAVFTQNGQPLAFTSRVLSDAETLYAEIEKKILATVFGLEKFHQYTYGRRVTVQTDHKPPESIVSPCTWLHVSIFTEEYPHWAKAEWKVHKKVPAFLFFRVKNVNILTDTLS